MKKFVYTLSLLCFFVTSSFAQDANAAESQELTKKEKRQLKKETKKKDTPPSRFIRTIHGSFALSAAEWDAQKRHRQEISSNKSQE